MFHGCHPTDRYQTVFPAIRQKIMVCQSWFLIRADGSDSALRKVQVLRNVVQNLATLCLCCMSCLQPYKTKGLRRFNQKELAPVNFDSIKITNFHSIIMSRAM